MRGDGWVLRGAVRDVNRLVHVTVCRRDLTVVTLSVRAGLSTVDQLDQLVPLTRQPRPFNRKGPS